MEVTFWGVRGSCPCSFGSHMRYGGNTSCVEVSVPGNDPLLLDLGTGLFSFAGTQPLDGTFRAAALVTHAHWDHIQGLPFFAPVNRVGAELDIFGPAVGGRSLEDVFTGAISPPYFPIPCQELDGKIRFHEVSNDQVQIGSSSVTVRQVPHPGPTLGYRIDAGGASVAYVPDHQAPPDLTSVDAAVLELCDSVDLLIHDAQYSSQEYAAKSHWGHCTVEYSVTVARESGAAALALFHHDPAHDDDEVERLLDVARTAAAGSGVDVFAAAEGRVVSVGSA